MKLARLFLGALISASAIPTIAAAGTLKVEYYSVTASTARVKVTVVVPNYYPCGGTLPCSERTVTLHVSPCPPDQPCTNDTFDYTMTGTTLDLDLDTNVNYTFSGTYLQRIGVINRGVCSWICTHTEPLGPTMFRSNGLPKWEITPVATNEDTVWVDVRLTDNTIEESVCRGRATCFYKETVYKIHPCPLAIAAYPDQMQYFCDNGTMFYRDQPPAEKQRFALHVGQQYTIDGWANITGMRPEMGGACIENDCYYSAAAETKIYTPATLATRTATWGQIKAMYRE